MEARTHIALVTIPVLSHQVSILEFAKTLVNLYKDIFHVTCIIPTISNSLSIASKPFFDTLPSNIQCIYLPPTNFEDIIRNEVVLESQVQILVTRSMPLVSETLRSIISTSSNNMVALIVDGFAHETHEFAKELNILSYTCFPCSAMVLSMCLYSSKLDETIACEYKDHPQPIEIPGCISVNGTDLPDSVQDRSNLAYKLFLHRSKQLRLADGIIINTFLEMESKALKAIPQNGILYGTTPNVYPIGPIIQTRPTIQKNMSKCLLWLDNQLPNSVLFISFGSGGTLSQDQINELALGLEFSNYIFLWVNVRPPNNKATATYLSNEEVGPLHFLPLGFLQRTKGRGLVMCDWAPQVEVLKHNAIGAFLTHCGWNSILESIIHGVTMIAWPLFAEPRSNAALVTNGLKVALRPKCNSKGIVEKVEVANLIKGVMEGLESEEIRRRVKELQKYANCAMMEDGSSMKTLSMLALKWMGLGRPIEN